MRTLMIADSPHTSPAVLTALTERITAIENTTNQILSMITALEGQLTSTRIKEEGSPRTVSDKVSGLKKKSAQKLKGIQPPLVPRRQNATLERLLVDAEYFRLPDIRHSGRREAGLIDDGSPMRHEKGALPLTETRLLMASDEVAPERAVLSSRSQMPSVEPPEQNMAELRELLAAMDKRAKPVKLEEEMLKRRQGLDIRYVKGSPKAV